MLKWFKIYRFVFREDQHTPSPSRSRLKEKMGMLNIKIYSQKGCGWSVARFMFHCRAGLFCRQCLLHLLHGWKSYPSFLYLVVAVFDFFTLGLSCFLTNWVLSSCLCLSYPKLISLSIWNRKRMKLLVCSSAEFNIGCDQASAPRLQHKMGDMSIHLWWCQVEIPSFDFSMSIASVLSVAWATIATPGFGGIDNFSSVEVTILILFSFAKQ